MIDTMLATGRGPGDRLCDVVFGELTRAVIKMSSFKFRA